MFELGPCVADSAAPYYTMTQLCSRVQSFVRWNSLSTCIVDANICFVSQVVGVVGAVLLIVNHSLSVSPSDAQVRDFGAGHSAWTSSDTIFPGSDH